MSNHIFIRTLFSKGLETESVQYHGFLLIKDVIASMLSEEENEIFQDDSFSLQQILVKKYFKYLSLVTDTKNNLVHIVVKNFPHLDE